MRDWCAMLDTSSDRAEFLSRLRRITAGYVAIADAPAYVLLPELLALYPDAKVVLVTRDRDAWYRSMEPIMKSVRIPMWGLELLLWPCPTWRWLPQYFRWAGKRCVCYFIPVCFLAFLLRCIERKRNKANRHRFADSWVYREAARIGTDFTPSTHTTEPNDHAYKNRKSTKIVTGLLDKHNEWVRNNVPRERFLEMDLQEGWAPLADFLGVPVPKTPFPRANDAAEAEALTKRIFLTAGLSWAGILATAAAAAAWQVSRWWPAR